MKLKKLYSFFLILTALLCSGTAWGASPLTVADGSATNDKVPVWGNWLDADDGSRNQLLYPASLLSEMENKNITSMTFYLSSSAAAAWTSNFTIGLAVVEETKFADDGGFYSKNYYYNAATTTTVYTGTLDATGSTLVITFSDPFLYEGGNLLVNFSAPKGNYKDATFTGENQTVCLSLASHSGTAVTSTTNGYTFLPKTSFAYADAAPVTCAKPTTVTVAEENITFNSATITLAGLTNATVEYKKKSATDYSVAQAGVTGNSYLLENLDSYTEYDVQVKNVCGGTDGESGYVKASFRTKCGPKTIPFEAYGFDDITYSYGQYAIPACWDKVASGNYPYIYNYYAHSASNCLYFYGGKSTSEQAIIFPDFSASLAGYTLTFYHNESVDASSSWTSYVYAHFEVGYIKDNVFTTISGPLAQLSAYAEDPTEVVFTEALPEGAKLAIRYAGGEDTGSGYIDDVAIKVTPSCTKPTLNNATDQTFEGATFTWDGSAAQYQYAVVTSGASVEAWSEPTSEKTYTVTGKAAATTFDFYVRSYCGTSEQSDGVKKSFTTATIPAPTNVIVSGETTDGANASWDAVPGISQYQYVVMEAGVTADWTSPTTVNTNAATISSLLPGQSYDLYVRSYYAANGATSSATPKKNFKTICEDISSIAAWTDGGFEESDANAVPNCWIAKTSDESNTYKPAMYVNTSASYVRTGSKSLLMKAYNDSGEGYAIFPVISDASLSSLQLKFWHKKETAAFILKLGYLTDINDLSSFVELHTCANATVWTEETVDLSTLPSGARLAFYYFGTSSTSKYSVGVDDITFAAAPACAAPESVSVVENSVTPEGATLSWASVGDGAQYQYAVKESGDPQDGDWSAATTATSVALSEYAAGTTYTFYVRTKCATSESDYISTTFAPEIIAPSNVKVTSITNEGATATWDAGNVSTYKWCVVEAGEEATWDQSATTTSAALENLDPDTEYDFYVKSVYAANNAEAAAEKVTFRTKCDPFTVSSSATYEVNFENGIPTCWDASEYTKQYSFYNYAWEANNAGQDGNCIRFYNYYTTHVLATEPIVLSADAALRFYYKNTKGSDFQVMISVGGADRVNLGEALGTATAWTEKEIDLTAYTGSTVVLYFCGNSSTAYDPYLYLDELTITAWPACRKPATINPATDITGTSATISWTAGGTATDYQYVVALKDETPIWNNATVVNALTVGLTDLEPLTAYDVYVRSYCGENEQSEAQKVSFTTGCGVYAIPFIEDFNTMGSGSTVMPDQCWENTTNSGTAWKGYNGGYEGKSIYFDSYLTDNGDTAVVATPSILISSNDAALKFMYKNKDGGALKVQLVNMATADTIVLDTYGNVEDWTEQSIDLAAYANKTVKFLFHGTSNGHEYAANVDAYIRIDDLRVVSATIALEDSEDNTTALQALQNETVTLTINRTIFCDGYFNTLCLPFDLASVEGTPLAGYSKLMKLTEATVNSQTEELELVIEHAASIEAGMPYLISFPAGDNIVNPTFTGVTITATTGQTIDLGNDISVIGILKPEMFTANNENMLFLLGNNTLTWAGVTNKLKGFRAYFQLDPNAPSNAPVRRGMGARIVEKHETITGVGNVDANAQTEKRLENNQVVIIRNGVKYNIQGQVISK